MAKPQDEINGIWAKYRTSLTQLITSLEENDALRSELDVDFSTPSDIVDLEKRVEEKLANNGGA